MRYDRCRSHRPEYNLLEQTKILPVASLCALSFAPLPNVQPFTWPEPQTPSSSSSSVSSSSSFQPSFTNTLYPGRERAVSMQLRFILYLCLLLSRGPPKLAAHYLGARRQNIYRASKFMLMNFESSTTRAYIFHPFISGKIKCCAGEFFTPRFLHFALGSVTGKRALGTFFIQHRRSLRVIEGMRELIYLSYLRRVGEV